MTNKYEFLNKNDYDSDMVGLYSKLFPFVKPYLFRGILGIIFALPVGLMNGIMPFGIKFFVDGLTKISNGEVYQVTVPLINHTFNLTKNILHVIPLCLIVATVLLGVFMYLNTYLNAWASSKITIAVQKRMYEKLLEMESAFYDNKSSGEIITRFLSDASAAANGFLGQAKLIITQAATAITYVFILFYSSWKLSLIAIGILSFIVLPFSTIRKKITNLSNRGVKLGGIITTAFNETFGGNKTIKAYNLQEYRVNKFTELQHEAFVIGIKGGQIGALLKPFIYFVSTLGISVVLYLSINMILSGEITLGSFFAFTTTLLLFYTPIRSLGNTYQDIKGSLVAMERAFKILDYKPAITDNIDAKELNIFNKEIKFENVLFEYEESKPVLKNINLTIKKGETIALVGNSGGGKSTIASLIPRFYDVKSGCISIDGVDIKNVKQNDLRANISIVFQDNFLFGGTIRENLLLGNFNATEDDLNNAIEKACLTEFVQSLEKGIDTHIGERGSMVSGGQKQRIAIARALLKDAPIVILDEATSALDNKSEVIVQKAIENLMLNKTVIVIAHRLSTIRNSDRIVVLNEGDILEVGSHEELIKNDNAYKALYDAQFKSDETLSV